ncbi:MAG: PEP-CTERM sorting domain-containing protein [Pirellulaceae bacterium]|nr:PEP-CTERM sorting domain-containing protein [Pirellulaceae bacterium]
MSRIAVCLYVCWIVSQMPLVAQGGIVIAGVDTPTSSTADFTIQINDPFFPGGFSELVKLNSGAFSIIRQQQQGLGDGSAASFIDTEILGLTLTSTSANVGPMTVRIGADNGVQQSPTLGRVTNVVSSPAGSPVLVGPNDFVSGNSFFDVFFEVDFAGGTLYNRAPHKLSLPNITTLPPNGTHVPPPLTPPVPLHRRMGTSNSPSDPVVGSAIGTHTVPEPSSILLFATGLLALAKSGICKKTGRCLRGSTMRNSQ